MIDRPVAVLIIIAAIAYAAWKTYKIARDHRDPCAEIPQPGSLGRSRWVEIDEWESEHVDSMLDLFADREQYDVDLSSREIKGSR